MNYFNPFSSPFWLTIGVAVLCGTIIGLERQLRGKPAGVRTSCLICLGTAVFIHLGSGVASSSSDPTRVLGQLVTGIGFLGAGVILAREGTVSGVTTAAVIWVLAAIGAAIGLGHLLGAIALSAVTVGILTGMESLESAIKLLRRGVHSHERGSKNGDPGLGSRE
ncbi:MAG: MgtC/SapB family protein [Candidatus Eisenbacteria bacterium]|uniref:MgtC/SapB family protein n=1 Tax=Eiseniibacteriota bacterium TaxID=2212470 RepID=A0A948W850_UNCEI|nr:MgtC/SapB family protein [Candidatus Eisenbacteria bacterium]MBU1947923.1 MgtC/SapB family protein [Candidatus Eisenbacteria bacterium]MBU2692336.1 MgtC/SapB family protein [Candidatus Eisenbacteria bacterium]